MRKNGTIYEAINALPENALPVSTYAREQNIAVGQIYMKYKRYLNGSSNKPDYTIRCFKGANFVIPQ